MSDKVGIGTSQDKPLPKTDLVIGELSNEDIEFEEKDISLGSIVCARAHSTTSDFTTLPDLAGNEAADEGGNVR